MNCELVLIVSIGFNILALAALGWSWWLMKEANSAIHIAQATLANAQAQYKEIEKLILRTHSDLAYMKSVRAVALAPVLPGPGYRPPPQA